MSRTFDVIKMSSRGTPLSLIASPTSCSFCVQMFRFVNPSRKHRITYAVSPSIVDVAVPGCQGGLYRLANFSPASLPDTCSVDKQGQVNWYGELSRATVQTYQARHSESYLQTGGYNATSAPCASVLSHTRYAVSNS